MNKDSQLRFRFALSLYVVLGGFVILGAHFGLTKIFLDIENERQLLKTTEVKSHGSLVNFRADVDSIEAALGPFSSEVKIMEVDTIIRDGYLARENEAWTGNVQISGNVVDIQIRKGMLNAETIRYYLARGRLMELQNETTSAWVRVGLPHLLRTESGLDKESLALLNKYGLSKELDAPDLSQMKVDPVYRDRKRGESWLMMYYLTKVNRKTPKELFTVNKDDEPTFEELNSFLPSIE